MVEFQTIQQRGFHNTYDENGEIDGFEFRFVPRYYKGSGLPSAALEM